VRDGDIKVLNIGTHDLAWSAVWISLRRSFQRFNQSFSMESHIEVVRSCFM
jgi:hypothetical protein